jgi:hypothetical protein
VQGISPAYGDDYVAQLHEQDQVITHLPEGRYALVNVANPEGIIAEATTADNSSMVYVKLEGDTARVIELP